MLCQPFPHPLWLACDPSDLIRKCDESLETKCFMAASQMKHIEADLFLSYYHLFPYKYFLFKLKATF